MADGFLLELGFNARDLVAGASGGIVNAFVFKRSTPVAIIGSVIVGALVANYLVEWGTHLFGTGVGATAFLLGMGGMALCQAIIGGMGKVRFFSAVGESDGGK